MTIRVARTGQSAVLLQNGEVLVAGGDGNTPSTAELYNPATGTWTATGSMTTARSADLILLHSGEVLAAGGDNNVPSTAEVYNPVSGTWAATGSMTAGGFRGSAVLLPNGQVLAVGANVADLYIPSTGSWNSTTPPLTGTNGYIALLPSGQVWFGGTLYDPATAQWTAAGGPSPCKGCATTMLANGTVLAAGGVVSVAGNPYPTEETVKSAELWDLAVGEKLGCLCLSWAGTGNLTTSSRAGESMVLLSNGQALVSGGYTITNSGSSVVLASAELYTP